MFFYILRKCHNELDDEPVTRIYNYKKTGHLIIKKQGEEKIFKSVGELEFFDRERPMIYFNSQNIVPLKTRQVIGLRENQNLQHRIPTVESIIVDGVDCNESIPNIGVFGQSYDAQVANIDLIDGVNGFAGEYRNNSRAAVWIMGPPSGKNVVSYAAWFQTQSPKTMTL